VEGPSRFGRVKYQINKEQRGPTWT